MAAAYGEGLGPRCVRPGGCNVTAWAAWAAWAAMAAWAGRPPPVVGTMAAAAVTGWGAPGT